MKKFDLCWGLLKLGKNFVTDVIIDNCPVKIDVYNMDDKVGYVIIDENQQLKCVPVVDFEIEIINIGVQNLNYFKVSLSRRNSSKRRQREKSWKDALIAKE